MNIEHENTARALRGAPLIIDSVWCRFGWHRWTRWSKGEWYKTPNYSSHKVFRQASGCIHCNSMRIREVSGADVGA